jgi:hypothetical protein
VTWQCAREQPQKCDHDREGVERANGVSVNDGGGTTGDEEGAGGCGVASMMEAAACVGKVWERESG